MLLNPERWKSLRSRYEEERPRKMLALDGGGIRGVLTLGILERIEAIVAERTGQSLCEFFDYIGGTSTGAIIAACLARGMSTKDLFDLYRSMGEQMFEPSCLVHRLKSFYRSDPLKRQLKRVFGDETDLDPDYLKCLLLVVTKNVTTDSPWPISSNPAAKYNDPMRLDSNLRIPLWQLVRASTAAPVYFPPEIVHCDTTDPSKTFVFVDGGITPYNNPAFLLYRMATEPAYRLGWRTGERELLLISVGTGAAESQGATAAAPNKNLFANVADLPRALMYGIQVEQDVACRTVGRCTYGAPLDRELSDLIPSDGTDPIPLTVDLGRNFLYARYNIDLSGTGLARLGFPTLNPSQIQRLDATENIPALTDIGRAAAQVVDPAHWGTFV